MHTTHTLNSCVSQSNCYLSFLCVDYGEDDDDDDEEDYLKPDSDCSPTSTGDATQTSFYVIIILKVTAQ